MIAFHSPREARLWAWTGAVVLGIYLSAGWAGALSQQLAERGILEPAFALGFLLVAVAIVGNAVEDPGARRQLWLLVGVLAALGMILVRLGVSAAHRTHLFEYGLVGVLVYEALAERVRAGGRVSAPGVAAVVAAGLLGWIDEGIQAVLPGRVYDLRDVAFNLLAALGGVAGTSMVGWVRRRRDPLARRLRSPHDGSHEPGTDPESPY